VLKLIDRADGWVRQTVRAKPKDHDEVIRQAYLRTLSRLPTEQEQAIARKHLAETADLAAGLRNLMWALLNTKEFIVNH